MLPGQEGNTEMAIIEFDSKEEALGALVRDQKLFNENTIEVQIDAGSTLWVTNFPETADEGYIRDLFGKVRNNLPPTSVMWSDWLILICSMVALLMCVSLRSSSETLVDSAICSLLLPVLHTKPQSWTTRTPETDTSLWPRSPTHRKRRAAVGQCKKVVRSTSRTSTGS